MNVCLALGRFSYMPNRTFITTFALLSACVASLYYNVVLIQTARRATGVSRPDVERFSMPPISAYSLIGDDYPKELPIHSRPVKVTVEETVHYSLVNPEAGSEWLWTAPYGDNHVRLGPEMRTFGVSMFHQLHCVRGIRDFLEMALTGSKPVRADHLGHIHHCFNYLRQWTLCSADVTLEPGDFTLRNFTTERFGATHVCRDWRALYDTVNTRWMEWEEYRDEHGIPPSWELIG